jgi:predicted metal-dependent hydrolase
MVDVVRKDIKNLHLAVYPPDGRVRVAAPLLVDDDAVRLAVVDRLAWIRRQRTAFERQQRQSRREMVTGESHFLWGQRYLLDVVEREGPFEVRVRNGRTIELSVRPEADRARREHALTEWYRDEIKARVPGLITSWEPVMDVDVADWGVKRMRTKWGSCSIEARRIWLNLELAKKPPECLEYIVVHEMVHLLERRHTDRFRALMDDFLPDWRPRRAVLNAAPLAHEEWDY